MRVMFSKAKAEAEGYIFPNFPDLTDGKIYEVEDFVDLPDDANNSTIPGYILVEDDVDEQVPYEASIFEAV